MADSKVTVGRLGTERIGKLMLEFAIPSIVSISLTSIYNLIDAIFLGQMVGDVGIAVTQAAYPLSMTIMTLFSLPGVGGLVLVSVALGAGRREDADLILGNTTTYTLFISGFCTLLGLVFLEPVLTLSGATDEIMAPAKWFASIIVVGTILQGLFLNLNNFIRGAGNPRRALLYNGGGMALCIAFNFLFVVLLGWGVVGSALATVLGQAISALLILAYFRSQTSVLRLRRRCLPLAKGVATRILVLGIPLSFAQLVYCIVAFIMNYAFIRYGLRSGIDAKSALAVVGIISRISLFASFALFGVSIAAQPIMGYNFGAGHTERLRGVFWVAVIWSVAIACAALLAILLFSRQIVDAFGLSPPLIALTRHLLRICLLSLPLAGFSTIVMQYYQAIAKAGISTVLAALKQGILLVPLLFALPELLPLLLPGLSLLDALIWAVPVSDGIAFMVSALLIAREFRRQKGIDALRLAEGKRCRHAA
jgi:putative MATE family efflux protein